jgi:hypothetical protein
MKQLIAVVAIVVLGSAAMALATPGHGDIHRADMARGKHADGGTIRFDAGTETVMFTFTMAPGSTSGWHRHPGAVVVLVKSGTLTTYGLDQPPCTGVDLPTGAAYFEDDAARAQWPHFVRNKSATETVEAVVTAFNVPVGAPVRSEAPAPEECDDPV